MHHAIETGDIGPLEILTTKTTIDAAQVERLEALAVQQGLSEPQSTQTTQKAEAVPPPVPQSQPSVQEEAMAQETTVAEEIEGAAVEETQQAQAEIQKTEEDQVTEEQQAQIEEAQAAIEQAEEDLSALNDLYDSIASAAAMNEDAETQETQKEEVDKKENNDNISEEVSENSEKDSENVEGNSSNSKGMRDETGKSEQSESEDDIRRILESNRKGYKVLADGRGATPGDEWRKADVTKISELSKRLLREEYESGGRSGRLDLIIDNEGNEYLVNAPNYTYNNLQKLFKIVTPETKQMLSDHTLDEFKKAKFTITSADGLSSLTVLENGDIVNLINEKT